MTPATFVGSTGVEDGWAIPGCFPSGVYIPPEAPDSNPTRYHWFPQSETRASIKTGWLVSGVTTQIGWATLPFRAPVSFGAELRIDRPDLRRNMRESLPENAEGGWGTVGRHRG